MNTFELEIGYDEEFQTTKDIFLILMERKKKYSKIMRSKTVDKLLKSTPKDIEIFVDLYADIVVRINQLLNEKQISRKELAQRLEKKPSEISKWLNGEHNFTLRSLAKLSAELGEPLLQVPVR